MYEPHRSKTGHQPCLVHSGHGLLALPGGQNRRRLLPPLQTERPQDHHRCRPVPDLLRRQRHRGLHLPPVRHRLQPQPQRLHPLRQLPPTRLLRCPSRLHLHFAMNRVVQRVPLPSNIRARMELVLMDRMRCILINFGLSIRAHHGFETHLDRRRDLTGNRVELERLRLLCERIIKREKFKRELVLCSHDILASNRDSVTLSSLAHSSYFPPDVSSESATTSLKGYTDDYKSGSEAHQRSDDLTVDSTIAGKRRVKFPVPVENDQKTDDSSTSQQPFEQKPKERTLFSGKQIPHRPAHRASSIASESTSDDGEKRSKYRKHTETFEKELVMTSDQASMRNQRLPKGFVYVPIGCLSNEKESVPDASSRQKDGAAAAPYAANATLPTLITISVLDGLPIDMVCIYPLLKVDCIAENNIKTDGSEKEHANHSPRKFVKV
ncbi:hypothetical protein RJ639_005662 [Escallonia herrerae]|uniref:Uncharacterized protein n=1 Tax=Escallonia herrerae TaxID=1293975 RepID=A0AA88VWY4_9ASTE|nr:hypothetical protein RJ639_005662 [Escallonia herrerae]